VRPGLHRHDVPRMLVTFGYFVMLAAGRADGAQIWQVLMEVGTETFSQHI
jgi:hypothetical protein